MKKLIGALVALTLAVGGGLAISSPATATPPTDVGVKVFVCKYVGTPGTNESLQTGNNPISVSVNAIPDYQGVGSYFADAQGRSYVLALDERQGGGQTGEPSITECPAPDVPETPCITVVWKMPSWVGPRTPTWGQTIVAPYPTECYNLNVPIPPDCGTQYQIDSYLNNDITAELIRRGILNAPNNPRESFPPNAGWDKTYKLVQNPACPPEPETKVEYGNWVVGEYGCDDTQVTETRTVTTTTYTLVNNVWVGTAVVTQDTPRTRDLMVEELDALFCPGPQPDDKVLVSEWTDGKYECDDTIVEQTRTVTTTPYVLDGETWVEGESKVVTETQTRDLTAEELAELVCPTPTPIPTPSDPPLASTGGSDTSGILVVGLALLGVGFLITAFRVARKLARV